MTDQPTHYRRRPAEIEAVQWTDTNAEALAAFAGHRFMTVDPEDRIDDPDATASLVESAHECWSLLRPGDWVVKRGDDFAVLTSEEFVDLYEPVESPEAPTPCSQPNPCEDGELCAHHEEEQAHADGEHEHCGITCETQMPSAPMYNAIVAHGIPGTGGMLNELLRRAAAGLLPTAEERQPDPDVVAFRNPDQPNSLWCREHGLRWWGLTPLTSGDLPDGGVCGQCGVDVLIPQEA